LTKIWNFLSSTILTIVLAILICLNAIWGSILTVRSPEFYRSLDQEILLPKLFSFGTEWLGYTLWIYILIVLVAFFALNTFVCTTDRIISIYRSKSPWQSILPHIVHIGFLIAMVGHLLGSAYGFKTPENFIMEGDSISVPTRDGLKVRLDKVDVKAAPNGRDIVSLKTTVTLLEGTRELLTDDIEINGPLIYEGIAFYHLSHGQMPMGLILNAGGVRLKAAFDSSFTVSGKGRFTLGPIYPDFALDSRGSPTSRSGQFRNPYQEIISEGGERGYLSISRPGSMVVIEGTEIVLQDFTYASYALLAINKDPGIGFIIVGSSVLTLGIILIFIFRGGRAELIRRNSEVVEI
jgi:cytochrome c biogenesis protein ResB